MSEPLCSPAAPAVQDSVQDSVPGANKPPSWRVQACSMCERACSPAEDSVKPGANKPPTWRDQFGRDQFRQFGPGAESCTASSPARPESVPWREAGPPNHHDDKVDSVPGANKPPNWRVQAFSMCERACSPAVLSLYLFFTLVTGPRRSLGLKLSDTRVYEPQIRAQRYIERPHPPLADCTPPPATTVCV